MSSADNIPAMRADAASTLVAGQLSSCRSQTAVQPPADIFLWYWQVLQETCSFSDFSRFTGGTAGTVTLHLEEVLHHILPQDLPIFLAEWNKCLKGKSESCEAVFRMKARSGEIVRVWIKGQIASRDADGKVLSVMGVHQEITGFKEAGASALEPPPEATDAPGGLLQWDWDVARDQVKVYGGGLAKACHALMLHDADDASWLGILPVPDRNRLLKTLRRYASGQTKRRSRELRFHDGNGVRRWGLMLWKAAAWTEQGTPSRVVGALMNVDGLRKRADAFRKKFLLAQKLLTRRERLIRATNVIAEDMLQARNVNFDEAVNNALKRLGEAVAADGVFILRNLLVKEESGFRCQYGWLRDEWEEPFWNNNLFFPYQQFDDWKQILSQGRPVAKTFLQGPPVPLPGADKARPLLLLPVILDGEFWGCVYFSAPKRVSLVDRQEKESLTALGVVIALAILRNEAVSRLLKKSEESSVRAKSVFLATISHELRTPLNAIMGMTALARKNAEEIEHCLEKIESSSRYLLGFIDDILEMTAIESKKVILRHDVFAPAELFASLQSALAPMAAEKEQTFSVSSTIPPSRLFVGDGPRLSRALFCLLSNAVKFTPEKGVVSLRSFETPIDGSRAHVRIVIKDNGIGIDSESLKRLFLPFNQGENGLSRTYEGAGMGLSIARGIFDAMGGSIEVDSALDRGSTFTVCLELPIHKTERKQLEAPPPAEETPSSLRGKRVLLVEDNDINREIMLAMLSESGLCIDCAENGLTAYEKFSHAPERYDVVLMDIRMPVMDGYEAAGKIRELPCDRAKTTPIIALTANCLPEDREKSLRVGMNEMIGKPVDFPVLLETMDKLIKTSLFG